VATVSTTVSTASTSTSNLEGCSHGYWKNHETSWTNYSPTDTLGGIGLVPSGDPNYSETLDGALTAGGGGETNLLRQAVAALLNANDPTVGPYYPLTDSQIKSIVFATIQSGNAALIDSLGTQLDTWNNLGCPLS
jgi:hypothetical protein